MCNPKVTTNGVLHRKSYQAIPILHTLRQHYFMSTTLPGQKTLAKSILPYRDDSRQVKKVTVCKQTFINCKHITHLKLVIDK